MLGVPHSVHFFLSYHQSPLSFAQETTCPQRERATTGRKPCQIRYGPPLHMHMHGQVDAHFTIKNQDAQETVKAYTHPHSQRTTITWEPYVVDIQTHTTHLKSQSPKNTHTHP
ncbi:hypothetical protein A4X13_0g6680 [Tilletia indica]|uniref:Uncharacterized protein n=1 Tax=Tilletia indica TaxID=43049 RepID=A0A8T8SMV5_9BASI|nr:hypothetical protein A4X13_0g6680 [Tilletia indica]